MSEIKQTSMVAMITVLTGMCVLSGVILAGIHFVTAKPIADAVCNARIEAVAQVLPAFNNNPIDEATEIVIPELTEPLTVYPAELNGTLVGAAVESYSPDGFSGEIAVIYGFNVDGELVNYHVMSHAETPGLGAKMEDWFRSELGNRSVIGVKPKDGNLTVAKDGGDIDGITAATITSRAFLSALNSAWSAFEIYKEQSDKK